MARLLFVALLGCLFVPGCQKNASPDAGKPAPLAAAQAGNALQLGAPAQATKTKTSLNDPDASAPFIPGGGVVSGAISGQAALKDAMAASSGN